MYHTNKDKTYRLAWIVAVPLMVCMLLSGCSIGSEKKIKIFSIEKPRENLNYPMPTALELEQIKWIIITSENAEEVFAKLEAAGIDPVLFGITDKDYQVLARNFAQIRRGNHDRRRYRPEPVGRCAEASHQVRICRNPVEPRSRHYRYPDSVRSRPQGGGEGDRRQCVCNAAVAAPTGTGGRYRCLFRDQAY